MFPSLFNIILCGVLVADYFTKNLLNDKIYIVLLGVVFVFNIISFLASLTRKRSTNKKINILKELLKSLGANSDKVDLNDNLKLIVDEVGKIKQKTSALNKHNNFLQNHLVDNAKTLKNIDRVLSYLNANNLDYAKELIIKNNDKIIKNIYSLTKTTNLYETHYDDFTNAANISYKGASIAIVNNDMLENYLLSLILKQFEIQVSVFEKVDDFANYSCVIIDENYDYNNNNCIILSDNYNKTNYLKRPFSKVKLKELLVQKLQNHQSTFSDINFKNDVLVFLNSSIKNEHMLHIANKHAKLNTKVDSISSFKQELENEYKIIAISYECILYDYEALVSKINHIKSTNPSTCIMLFLGDNCAKKNIDFADIIIKDATETQIAEEIKKHI